MGHAALRPQPQPSSSEVKIVNDNEDPPADSEFDKLATELLIDIFHHARPTTTRDAHFERHTYPVALSHVCRRWRDAALGAPTLWTNIRIQKYYTGGAREAARVYLERSKTCPISLTWFVKRENYRTYIEDLIIPAAGRWRSITLIVGEDDLGALLTAMEPVDFPVLQDIEVSSLWPLSPEHTMCRSAPLLRRCRFRDILSLPSLPSNLVVLDCEFSTFVGDTFDLDPLLEFLPHVAHSLEHMRFGSPPWSGVHFTARTSRIPLEKLKSLLIRHSHEIMDHIHAPNLTYFASHSIKRETGGMFDGFSAPNLQSIQFHRTPLRPFLATCDLPSMFPQLESILLYDCPDESTFVPLLDPPKPAKPSSSKKAPEYPPKDLKVGIPFPHLEELTISDMGIWDSLQRTIEERLKNGDKSLRKIQLPNEEEIEDFMEHPHQQFPPLGVELILYEHGELSRSPMEFQDEFCDEEDRLSSEISMEDYYDLEDEALPITPFDSPLYD